MATEYKKLSPYYKTPRFGRFLDVLTYRPIPKNVGDTRFTINAIYQYRPDLLANDLYGSVDLWWVFAARNPNVLKDPIWDFKAGRSILIPKGDVLLASLGQ